MFKYCYYQGADGCVDTFSADDMHLGWAKIHITIFGQRGQALCDISLDFSLTTAIVFD